MASRRSSTMSAVWFFDTPVLAEISSTRSALVIPSPPILVGPTRAAAAARASARQVANARRRRAEPQAEARGHPLPCPVAAVRTGAGGRSGGSGPLLVDPVASGTAVFVDRHPVFLSSWARGPLR